jgi:hypothetical protein
MTDASRDDYDSPWKEALERYFPDFLALLFPRIHPAIDWSKGHEFLDKELQQVVRDAESGRRHADKLARVYTHEGAETWVLVHVEVQGDAEAGFAERMYVYNYRIFDNALPTRLRPRGHPGAVSRPGLAVAVAGGFGA